MVYKDPTKCPVQFKVTVPKAGNMKGKNDLSTFTD